jgi:transcription initiation factor IIE alpha subunit
MIAMHPSITPEKERRIVSALETDSHASRVARALGDVSYATVWRIADRAGIELTAGREAKGYRRLSAERRARIEKALQASPEATQEELARQTGVSRSTIGRVLRAHRREASRAQAG